MKKYLEVSNVQITNKETNEKYDLGKVTSVSIDYASSVDCTVETLCKVSGEGKFEIVSSEKIN